MDHLEAAHRHLVASGARCEVSGSGFAPGKGARPGDLAKALPEERAEKATLVKVLGEIVPMLERLAKRVDDIARTPLQPLTIAKRAASVSKEQDRGGSASSGDHELPSEAIAAALAKMSKEEQTLMLIKASYANPIRVIGSAADEQ
jgi:hypothetical protein